MPVMQNPFAVGSKKKKEREVFLQRLAEAKHTEVIIEK